MAGEELLSIVVPIYNVDSYLHECVDSLLAQTYSNLEIILVDNGSTDTSPEICDYYVHKDKRVKVIHQKNAGLVNARKVGLNAATAEIIACVDGDDWVEPKMYETLYGAMTASNADIVVGGHIESFPRSAEKLVNVIPPGIYDKNKLIEFVYPKMLCSGKFSQFGIYSYHWNKLFRKSVIYDSQMQVDERIFIGEDAACVYPALLTANTICVVDACNYHYRQRTNSMVKTSENYAQEFAGISLLYRYLKQTFSATPYAKYLLPQLNLYILSLVTVRSDCFVGKDKENDSFFPFQKVKKGNRVVLFGAGTFGQHLYRRLIADNDIECVLWVDENYRIYQEFNLPVVCPNEILSAEFDYVIVAYIDECVAEKMKSSLCKLGVPNDKIAWIDYDLEKAGLILNKFGLEVN